MGSERLSRKYHVVRTSNVLHHLLPPDRKRLVETEKAFRAPGGTCLLREEAILPVSLVLCEARYANRRRAKHEIPAPEDPMRELLHPLELRRLGDDVWIAQEA